MKCKQLSLILCVFIIAVPLVCFCEDEPFLHQLWEIPFGISMQECKDIVLREYGITLKEDVSDTVGNKAHLRTSLLDSVSFMGYTPIMLNFTFEHNSLISASVRIPIDLISTVDLAKIAEENDTHFNKALKVYFDLSKQLEARYGKQTASSFLVFNDDLKEAKSNDYPSTNGKRDDAEILRILITEETVSFTEVFVNIALSLGRAKGLPSTPDQPACFVFITYHDKAARSQH